MPWILLAAAIVLEVAGTTSMKLADGYTRLVPTVAVVVCYGASFFLLGLVLKRLDMSVAYAIWAGLGTALITVLGAVLFKEPMSALKIGLIAMIVCGVVGLKLISGR